jgi:hypothetical protein
MKVFRRTRAQTLAVLCLLGIGLPGCQTRAAPPLRASQDGGTPLQHYAETCDLTPLGMALAVGTGKAQLEAPDGAGRTPLSLAARGGCMTVVSTLVREGANLERTDSNGWTALHHAASQRHADVVDFLLAHGAEQERKTNKGETPLALALVGSREQFGPPGDRHTTEMVLLSGHPRQKIGTEAKASIKPARKSKKTSKSKKSRPAAKPAPRPAARPKTRPAA